MTHDFVGAGIGLRRKHQDLLTTAVDPPVAVLEVIPEHFFTDPDALEKIARKYATVFHGICMSTGTVAFDERTTLEKVANLVEIARPLMFTEHLAMTTAPDGTQLGHLAPVWYTHDMLDVISRRVEIWQERLQVPIALETVTAPYTIPEADMSETEFFHRLVDRTGCGLLLDLSNQLVNAYNYGHDLQARLEEYPLHAVWQVHLAGGERTCKTWWVDSHNTPVAAEDFELLRWLRGRAPLKTIIVERDGAIPPLKQLVSEAHRAQQIWREDE